MSALNSNLAKYDPVAAWLTRLVLIVGVVGLYWLRGEFVSVAEFQDYKQASEARTITLEKVLIRMEAKLEHDARQDVTLGDHETRLRSLERLTTNERTP